MKRNTKTKMKERRTLRNDKNFNPPKKNKENKIIKQKTDLWKLNFIFYKILVIKSTL